MSNGFEHEISGYQGLSYTYYSDTWLQSVSDGVKTYRLYYDALGRYVRRELTTSGITTPTYYVYDGEKAILEYNAVRTARRSLTTSTGKAFDEIAALLRKLLVRRAANSVQSAMSRLPRFAEQMQMAA